MRNVPEGAGARLVSPEVVLVVVGGPSAGSIGPIDGSGENADAEGARFASPGMECIESVGGAARGSILSLGKPGVSAYRYDPEPDITCLFATLAALARPVWY